MKKILVCSNSDRFDSLTMTAFIVDKILGRGIMVKVFFPFKTAAGFKYPEFVTEKPQEEIIDSQLLIGLGGDGTLLLCSRLASEYDVPVLGINLGHKGFIAALEPDEIELLDEILFGNFQTEDRMMIAANVIRDGKTVFSDFGLNEASVRSLSSHSIKIAVFGDGVEIAEFNGDGIIIATPTGSTAYSMSAGGPIVEPSANNIIITPICAHALNIKTVILKSNRRVTVKFRPAKEFSAVISMDGNREFTIAQDDEIEVVKSEHITRLVAGTKRSFYEIVQKKLNTEL